MLEVYGAMSERKGIHDVVSSFSWLRGRLLISSRGRCWGSYSLVVVMVRNGTQVGSGGWIGVGDSSKILCDGATPYARRGDAVMVCISTLGTGDVAWDWGRTRLVERYSTLVMASHISMESVPFAKLKPPCGCWVPRA